MQFEHVWWMIFFGDFINKNRKWCGWSFLLFDIFFEIINQPQFLSLESKFWLSKQKTWKCWWRNVKYINTYFQLFAYKWKYLHINKTLHFLCAFSSKKTRKLFLKIYFCKIYLPRKQKSMTSWNTWLTSHPERRV